MNQTKQIKSGDIVQSIKNEVLGGLEVIDIIGENAICVGFQLDPDPTKSHRGENIAKAKVAFPLKELIVLEF